MIVKLDTQRLQTLDQVREFLAGSRPLDLQPETRAEAYAFVAETLQRFDYSRRGKADKGLIRRFLNKVTGLSRAQVTRLLHQHRTTGAIADRRRPRHPFPRRYTKADIGLLAEVDALHGTLSGPATRKLCVRALQLFGDRRFERLAAISNGHLYNLRHSTSYQRRRGTMPAPTRPVHIAIGERRRPQPFGQPGYLRVDSVHQGDLDGIKGLYHLNLVDEVTQFQFVGSVERIDTPCLAPVLEALLRAFPFNVRGFHTDNGSEFINHKIAARLQALHIDEFTKSRPRRSNATPRIRPSSRARTARSLPPRQRHDPLREAQVVAQRRRLPQAGDLLRPARRRRRRHERQRRGTRPQPSPRPPVCLHRPGGLKHHAPGGVDPQGVQGLGPGPKAAGGWVGAEVAPGGPACQRRQDAWRNLRLSKPGP